MTVSRLSLLYMQSSCDLSPSKNYCFTCCDAGCLFLTLVALGSRISVSLALVPAIPDIVENFPGKQSRRNK